jgi:uncharacterized Zn-binding protein involved in type VI secretion
MTDVARIGDPIGCGATCATGSGNVFANGIPVTRVSDSTTGDPCKAPPTTITTGSSTVTANGLPLASVGSAIASHACPDSQEHSSSVSAGSPSVTVD